MVLYAPSSMLQSFQSIPDELSEMAVRYRDCCLHVDANKDTTMQPRRIRIPTILFIYLSVSCSNIV